MTEDLTERLAGLSRAIAAPLPSPEELAAGKAADRAMAERIVKARPGVPLHHAYAVLETLRTIQRVEAAKAAPAPDEAVNPLVASIRAQLDAVDGMVDDTVAFVLTAAAEHIRARAMADKAQFPQHSNGRVGLLSAAHMIDPEGDGRG